jgi:hypothetical protein
MISFSIDDGLVSFCIARQQQVHCCCISQLAGYLQDTYCQRRHGVHLRMTGMRFLAQNSWWAAATLYEFVAKPSQQQRLRTGLALLHMLSSHADHTWASVHQPPAPVLHPQSADPHNNSAC